MRRCHKIKLLLSLALIGPFLVAAAPNPQALLTQAWRWHREHSYKRAIEPLRTFLAEFKDSPRLSEAQYLLGESLRRIPDRTLQREAEKELTKAALSDRADIWRARAQVSLARHYVDRGRVRPITVEQQSLPRVDLQALQKRPEANKLFAAAQQWFEAKLNQKKTPALRNELADIYLHHVRSLPRQSHKHRKALAEVLLKKLLALKAGAGREAEALYIVGSNLRKTEYLRTVADRYRDSEFCDDATYHLAQNLESKQNYRDALKYFRRLTARFTTRQSRWVRHAKRAIRNILAVTINVRSQFVALPGTMPKIHMRWRNASEAVFTLYRSDPLRPGARSNQFLAHVEVGRNEIVKSWTKRLEDRGEYLWRNSEEEVQVTKPGAYLLEVAVRGPGGKSRHNAWLLITRAVVVTKKSPGKIIVYAADCVTGEPRPGSEVAVHWSQRDGRRHTYRSATGHTNDAGMYAFAFPAEAKVGHFIVLARRGDHIAFSRGYSGWWQRRKGRGMGYVYTDRPVYRPKEAVHFKAIVRHYDGRDYSTVKNQSVQVRIHGPRGNKLLDKSIRTNEFGTLSGSLKLADRPRLGQYRIRMRWHNGNAYGSFRVEEYKRPEFEVKITADKPLYRIGDKLKIRVAADYYFGGPVAEADVIVIVHRRPYYHWHYPPRPYPWYFEGMRRRGVPWWPRHGRSFVKRAALKTDAKGQCTLTVDTPKEIAHKYYHGYVFDVEARVVDKSRREIRGQAALKITRDPFFVFVRPKHYLYYPGDRAEIDITSQNANGDPVESLGNMEIAKAKWSKEKKDYEYTPVLAKKVSTDAKGKALFIFKPKDEGYYRVRVTALTPKEEKVIGDGWVRVASREKGIIGYRHAGVHIVTDKDSYSRGETAHVLVTSQFPDAFVWFAVEADDVFGHRLLALKGTSKLFELPIEKDFTPNVFLSAFMVRQTMLWTHTRQIICPPDERFIDVKITAPKETFRPGEAATFTVRTTDKKGKPVATEVSLGLVDASVYYIQPEYAQDIRQFFYGRKRAQRVQTRSTFNQVRYHGKDLKLPERPKKAEGHVARGSTFGGRGHGEMRARLASRDSIAGAPAMGMEMAEPKRAAAKGAPAAPPAFKPAALRTDFRATALWQPTILTGKDGTAQVKVTFPDSLTQWRSTARAVTAQTEVGNVTHDTRTKKNIMCRLQGPRFFMERDRVVISAIVNNYLGADKKVRVSVDPSGLALKTAATRTVTVPKNGEVRVDWWCDVHKQGKAEITVTAETDEESDAMRKSFPIFPHGVEKFVAASGSVKDSVTETLFLPALRNPRATSLDITLSPSIASMMFDCLDYLAKYPYGCTEQTMSRFLPSVIVAKTLQDLGVSKPDLEAKLPKMVQAGLDRLYDFQRPDGSWGWWKRGEGDPWMTAYVLYGLTMAQRAGYHVEPDRIKRAVRWLRDNLVQNEDRMDTLAHIQYALSHHKVREPKWLERVWKRRDELNAYTRALLALTFHNLGDAERAKIMLRNMEDLVHEDKENGTAHWGRSGIYYRWSMGGIEATAYALKAYMHIEPRNRLVAPLMKWLVLNRRGNRWKSTRDTAIVVYALADYLRVTRELAPDYTLHVWLNGRLLRKVKVSAANALTFQNQIILNDADLQQGANLLRIERDGAGSLYYAADLTYYTKEEDIKGAGNEIFVNRTYTKIERRDDGAIERTPLATGATVRSGDRVEVKLQIEAKNNYEYLVFEDMKPSGFEPTRLRSGYAYGGLWSNMELRDELVAFFVSRMPQGEHTLTYELRAEVPGQFHTMPTRGFAMYVPEIRCISDEWRATVSDK